MSANINIHLCKVWTFFRSTTLDDRYNFWDMKQPFLILSRKERDMFCWIHCTGFPQNWLYNFSRKSLLPPSLHPPRILFCYFSIYRRCKKKRWKNVLLLFLPYLFLLCQVFEQSKRNDYFYVEKWTLKVSTSSIEGFFFTWYGKKVDHRKKR